MIRTRRIVPATAILLLLGICAFPQSTSIRVDGNIIKGYITTMSDSAHMGRRSMTPGYEKTADWAAGLFKQWGLKPAGENGTYFQTVPLTGSRSSLAWTLGVPELTIQGRSFYTRDNDFTVDSSSTPGSRVTGEIIFVGYGISAPAKGLDEYSTDVRGKIVLAFKGSPKDAPAPSSRFGPSESASSPQSTEAWAQESDDFYKAKVAYEKGAAAILLYNPPVAATGGGRGSGGGPAGAPGGGQQRRELDASPFTPPFVYVSNVDERVFRWIMWRDPQQSVREFNARIDQLRRDIKDKKVRSRATGLRATVKGYDSVTLYGEKFKNNTSRNVLGKIEGTDPNLKNQYVVLGGHMDHLGVNNGVVMNGADDNASGTAVAMEIGRLLAVHNVQPKRTVIVGLWCGEEQGLLGSRYYVTHPTDGVSMDRVVTYFNMDMVGLGDTIGAPGALNFPEIFDVILRNQDADVAKAVQPSTGGPGGSDHSGFIELGIEALALMTRGGGGHPDYHDSGDDSEKIEPEILRKTGQFVLQGVLNLANETNAGLLIPDRQHLYDGLRLTPTDMLQQSQGGRGGWQSIKAADSTELLSLATERAGQLTSSASGQTGGGRGGRGGRGGGSTRYNLGVRSAGVFDGNVALIKHAATLLNFGRVDVTANDGAWFNFNTGVSPQGREAVKAMEANNIAINLVNPSSRLLSDMLDASARPFLVSITGTAGIEPALINRMNQKNALLLFECDPANSQECVNRMQTYKKQFGDSDNLVVSVKTSPPEATEKAMKTIYMGLIKGGWTKDEIYAAFGAGSGAQAGGNLSRLNPPRQAGRDH